MLVLFCAAVEDCFSAAAPIQTRSPLLPSLAAHLGLPCSHAPTCPLQDVINASFARAASTEQALLLLRQFESLLARESFRADLDAKYLQAFQVRWLCVFRTGSWHTLLARRHRSTVL